MEGGAVGGSGTVPVEGPTASTTLVLAAVHRHVRKREPSVTTFTYPFFAFGEQPLLPPPFSL